MTDHRARFVGRLNRGLFAAVPAPLMRLQAVLQAEYEQWARWLSGQPLAGLLISLPAAVDGLPPLGFPEPWRQALSGERLLLVAGADGDEPLVAAWPRLRESGVELPVIGTTAAAHALAAFDQPFVVRLAGQPDAELAELLGDPAAVGAMNTDTGDLATLQDGLTRVKDDFAQLPVLSGLDRSPGAGLAAGANGLVSLIGALAPGALARLMRFWFDGHTEPYLALSAQLDRLAQTVWSGGDERLAGQVLAALAAQDALAPTSAAAADLWPGPEEQRCLQQRLNAVGAAGPRVQR